MRKIALATALLILALALTLSAQSTPCADCHTVLSLDVQPAQGQQDAFVVTARISGIKGEYYRQLPVGAERDEILRKLQAGEKIAVEDPEQYKLAMLPLEGAQLFYSLDDTPVTGCDPAPGAVKRTDTYADTSCTVSVAGARACKWLTVSYKGTSTTRPASVVAALCPKNIDTLSVISKSIDDYFRAQPEKRAACLPLMIVLGFLVAGMYFAGKNPLGIFDIARPALPQPRQMKIGRTSFFTEWKAINRELLIQRREVGAGILGTIGKLRQLGTGKLSRREMAALEIIERRYNAAAKNLDAKEMARMLAAVSWLENRMYRKRTYSKHNDLFQGASLLAHLSNTYGKNLNTQTALKNINAPPDWWPKAKGLGNLANLGWTRGAVGNLYYQYRLVKNFGKSIAIETKAAHGFQKLVSLVSPSKGRELADKITKNSADNRAVARCDDAPGRAVHYLKNLRRAMQEELALKIMEEAQKAGVAGKKFELLQKALADSLVRGDFKAFFWLAERIPAIKAAGWYTMMTTYVSNVDATYRNLSAEQQKLMTDPNYKADAFAKMLESELKKLMVTGKALDRYSTFFKAGTEVMSIPIGKDSKGNDIYFDFTLGTKGPGRGGLEWSKITDKAKAQSAIDARMAELAKTIGDFEYARQLKLAMLGGKDVTKITREDCKKLAFTQMLNEMYGFERLNRDVSGYKLKEHFDYLIKQKENFREMLKLGDALGLTKNDIKKFITQFDTKKTDDETNRKNAMAGLLGKASFKDIMLDTRLLWKTTGRDTDKTMYAQSYGIYAASKFGKDVPRGIDFKARTLEVMKGRLDDFHHDIYGKEFRHEMMRNSDTFNVLARLLNSNKLHTNNFAQLMKDGVTFKDVKASVWVATLDGTIMPFTGKAQHLSDTDKILNGIMVWKRQDGTYERYVERKHGDYQTLRKNDGVGANGQLEIISKQDYAGGLQWNPGGMLRRGETLFSWGKAFQAYQKIGGFAERFAVSSYSDAAASYGAFMGTSTHLHQLMWSYKEKMGRGEYDNFLGTRVSGMVGGTSRLSESLPKDETGRYLQPFGPAEKYEKNLYKIAKSAETWWDLYKDTVMRDPRIGSTQYGQDQLFRGLYQYGQSMITSPTVYSYMPYGGRYYGWKDTLSEAGAQKGVWDKLSVLNTARVSLLKRASMPALTWSYSMAKLAVPLVRTPEMLMMGWPGYHDEHRGTRGSKTEALLTMFRPWSMFEGVESLRIQKGPLFERKLDGTLAPRFYKFRYNEQEQHPVGSGIYLTDIPVVGDVLKFLGPRKGYHVMRGAAGEMYIDDGLSKRLQDYNPYFKGYSYAHTGLNVSGTIYSTFYGDLTMTARSAYQSGEERLGGEFRDSLTRGGAEAMREQQFKSIIRRDETTGTALDNLYTRQQQFTAYSFLNYPTAAFMSPAMTGFMVGRKIAGTVFRTTGMEDYERMKQGAAAQGVAPTPALEFAKQRIRSMPGAAKASWDSYMERTKAGVLHCPSCGRYMPMGSQCACGYKDTMHETMKQKSERWDYDRGKYGKWMPWRK